MGMSKCYSLMKCLLIIFNIIFLMVGCGAGAFAAWALYDGRASESAAGRAGLCALAAWAGALAAGALAALAGAVRHSASLLAAAFALLALRYPPLQHLFLSAEPALASGVAEGAAAWWGAAHAPALRAALRSSLARAVRDEYGAVPSRTAALDAIQSGLRCCGEAGARDWQASAWARRQQGAAPAAPAAPAALDLSVRAPPAYYAVPASCCATEDAAACERARRLPAASGAAAARALHDAPCGPRVLAALAAAARAPLAAAAALLAAHAAALLLALALCLRAHPDPAYKA